MSKQCFVPPGMSLLGLLCFIMSIHTSSLCHAGRIEASTVTVHTIKTDSTASVTDRPSSTSSVPAQTHTVQVGLADHKFRPEVTLAEVGDVVEFRFYPTNHSVVRAEYGFPCIPSDMIGTNKPGFFSGFHSSDKVLDDPPKFTLTINNTDPIFFYCSAPGSCTTFGMIGAINPNVTTSIDTQRQLARGSAYQLSPGEPFPDEGPRPSNAPNFTPSPPPTATPASASSSASAAAADATKHHNPSPAAIAGIAVGATALVLVVFFWGRTKALKNEVERKESSVTGRTSETGLLRVPSQNTFHGRDISSGSAQVQPMANPAPSPIRVEHTHQQQQPPQAQQHQPHTNLTIPQHLQPQIYTPTETLAPPYSPEIISAIHNTALPCTPRHPKPTPSFPEPPQSLHPAYASSPPHPSAHSPHPFAPSTLQPFSPTTLLVPPSLSPRTHATPERKLGPYGHQEITRTALRASSPAPPYGWHVNLQQGPAEMDAGGLAGRVGGRKGAGARWEEVRSLGGRERGGRG